MAVDTEPQQAVIAPKRPTARLDLALVQNIAELVVKYRMTESEAALQLNVRPEVWFNFKNRNGNVAKYDEVITRIRGANLANVISAIDKAGDGIGLKQPDWRAKAWIAERVLAPERFSDRQNQAQAPAQINVSIALQAGHALYAKAKQEQVIDIEPVKQLEQGKAKAD